MINNSKYILISLFKGFASLSLINSFSLTLSHYEDNKNKIDSINNEKYNSSNKLFKINNGENKLLNS